MCLYFIKISWKFILNSLENLENSGNFSESQESFCLNPADVEIKPVFVTYEDEKVYDNIIMENRKNKKKYRCCIKAIRES